MQPKIVLQDLGLTDKESRVYLGLLATGPAGAGRIAAQTDLKRTSIYNLIKSLNQKGMVQTTLRNNRRLFLARAPNRAVAVWRRRVQALEEAVPELGAISTGKIIKPKVSFLQGSEDIKEFFRSVLEDYAGKSYDVIGNTESLLSWDPVFFDEYRRRRAQAKIKTRLILTPDPASQEQRKHERALLCEIRFFPEKYQYEDLVRIYPDKVLFLSTHETNIGIVIESKEFVRTWKRIFEFMWEVLGSRTD